MSSQCAAPKQPPIQRVSGKDSGTESKGWWKRDAPIIIIVAALLGTGQQQPGDRAGTNNYNGLGNVPEVAAYRKMERAGEQR